MFYTEKQSLCRNSLLLISAEAGEYFDLQRALGSKETGTNINIVLVINDHINLLSL